MPKSVSFVDDIRAAFCEALEKIVILETQNALLTKTLRQVHDWRVCSCDIAVLLRRLEKT